MNNFRLHSPLFHTAICCWGFEMLLFIIIEWAFLNLATVSRVFTVPSPAAVPLLSRILPSDACKIYKQGLNIRQVLSTDAVSFRVKNTAFPQWSSLEVRLNVHASALWDLTGGFFVEVSSWKPVCRWMGYPVCGADCWAASQLPAVSFGIQNIPLLFWSWRVKETENERKGGKVHLHSRCTVPLASHPVITLFICSWLNEHQPFLLSPTSYRRKKSSRNPKFFSVNFIESNYIYNFNITIQGLVDNQALFSGDWR